MSIHKHCTVCRLVLLVLFLLGCNPGASTGKATPTGSVTISSDEAIELATNQCQMHKFALIGEPSSTKTMLISRTDVEKWTFPQEAAMEDIQNISEPVWLVQIQGEFQLEGGPLPESQTQPTAEPPRRGVCWVIVDAKTGEILGMQGQTN
jgi:hypothetical protein